MSYQALNMVELYNNQTNMAIPFAQTDKHSGTIVLMSGTSETGAVRAINQDSFFIGKLSRGYLAIVADGMGGHKTGEVASQKAVEIIKKELEHNCKHPPTAIARAVQTANIDIYDFAIDSSEHKGMGTTMTALYIDDQNAFVAQVGDSRAYLIRKDEILQLTNDHSWVAEQVRQGILTQDEAKHHRLRSVITNALGASPKVKLDVTHFELEEGDKLFLCSDGVSMLLSSKRLHSIISNNSPENAVRIIIKESNIKGSPDNITAIVLEVKKIQYKQKNYDLPEQNRLRPTSVALSETMSGVDKMEEYFPRQDLSARLKRQPWYPYRLWILGSLYLILLIIILGLLK